MFISVDTKFLPTAPVHALSPIQSSVPPGNGRDDERRDGAAELPRSASFTDLSESAKNAARPTFHRNFSEENLVPNNEQSPPLTDAMVNVDKELFRRASLKAKKNLDSSTTRFSLGSGDVEKELGIRQRSPDVADEQSRQGRSVTGSLRGFARKTLMSVSPPRSISPTRNARKTAVKDRSRSPTKTGSKVNLTPISLPAPVATRDARLRDGLEDSSSEVMSPSFAGRSTDSRNRLEVPHPLQSIHARNKSESSLKRLSRASSATSLSSRVSVDSSVPPMPAIRLPMNSGREFLHPQTSEPQPKRDPLWSVFRTLDAEFANFHSKTSLQKARVIRSSLLPFLARFAHHPSNKDLRAEDLDRRVAILNKWWTGLLEMLHGRNNQSISGTDRPAFLEAVTGIMLRDEWRIPFPESGMMDTIAPGMSHESRPAPAPPFPAETLSTISTLRSKSSYSIDSDVTDFILDSILHNVRNIFIQNLQSQLAFVVEKMSLRTTPATLVNFSGKTCAYAFFFCPGIAEMLLRLWRVTPQTVQRVLNAAGVSRADRLETTANRLLQFFPPPMKDLVTKSHIDQARKMQYRKPPPVGTEDINWYGPWNGRWSGRDSDLFFIFVKHFHGLVASFLEESLPLKERTCIPGFVMVHAQILTVLETTIYRKAGQNQVEHYPQSASNNADAPDSTATIPMTMANAQRSMAENRLIMLLRDVLSDNAPEGETVQDFLVSAYNSLIKASARTIAVYNSDACFALCDFMEELFPLMARYNQRHPNTPILDWSFWFEVCQMMLKSPTTLTQVRCIAFLYSMWNFLISNAEWKRKLVLDWLLEPSVFRQYFCHWSPMVRHYYFRLLCWRVARCDDDHPSDLDREIYTTVASRLNRCWAHYQFLAAEAEMRGMCPTSSQACSPAPSRSLVIVRTDSQPSPSTTFSAITNLLSPTITQGSPYDKHSSILNTLPMADTPLPNSKKKWNLFKGLGLFNQSPTNGRPGEVTPPTSPEDRGDPIAHGVDGRKSPRPISRPVTPPHQSFSFKFSLEYMEVRGSLLQRSRPLTKPQLPFNAQKIVDQLQSPIQANPQLDRRLSTAPISPAPSIPAFGPSVLPSSSTTKVLRRMNDVPPQKPSSEETISARYAGRALAEWSLVVIECRNFYLRRKQEGVPRDNLVETPVMGVDTFRMVG